jgi:heme-degrading monooxygenase HmoA
MIRIVKMTFDPDKVDEFESLFNDNKHKIRAFDGCTHLQLLKDINTPNQYFTYSFWKHLDNLEAYRTSELFAEVWSATKKLFIAKPEAWSVEQEIILE